MKTLVDKALACALMATTGLCAAGNPAEEPPKGQFILQWDNDLLTGTDEGYTNGARIAFARQLPTDSAQHNLWQDALRKLTGSERDNALGAIRFPDAEPRRFQYGVGLTQLMFTPEDTDAPTPPRGERPYAGWLGLEFSLQASAGDSASTATFSIGTTGDLSYAEDIQKWIHQNVSNSPVFQGWDSQAPAEPTLNLHFDHKQRLHSLKSTEQRPIEIDGFYEWGAALGNFRTDAYLGALFRVGHNLPARYAAPRVQLGSFTETIFDPERASRQALSLYGYAGLRGYAVLQDITLDGPFFRDWDESGHAETWVGQLNIGLGLRYRGIELSLAHTLRSDEFKEQRNRSRYGSLLFRIGGSF